MAKGGAKAELSASFLAANRHRLDAFGPWMVDADADTLTIRWTDPPPLRNGWLPMSLRVCTDVSDLPRAEGRFDPDEQMLGLCERFAARRDEFIGQLRAVIAPTEQIVGRATRAGVEVYRYLDPDEDMCSCDLRVSFRFADDGEHSCLSRYDPEADAFGPLEG